MLLSSRLESTPAAPAWPAVLRLTSPDTEETHQAGAQQPGGGRDRGRGRVGLAAQVVYRDPGCTEIDRGCESVGIVGQNRCGPGGVPERKAEGVVGRTGQVEVEVQVVAEGHLLKVVVPSRAVGKGNGRGKRAANRLIRFFGDSLVLRLRILVSYYFIGMNYWKTFR